MCDTRIIMKYKSKFKKKKNYEQRIKTLHFKKKSIYADQRIIKVKDMEKVKKIAKLQEEIRNSDTYYRPLRKK